MSGHYNKYKYTVVPRMLARQRPRLCCIASVGRVYDKSRDRGHVAVPAARLCPQSAAGPDDGTVTHDADGRCSTWSADQPSSAATQQSSASSLQLSHPKPYVGTNLIHDFTAVTFSVKLAFFREICPLP